jgi:hypothetical protein
VRARGRAAARVLLVALIAFLGLLARPSAATRWVIPPGQETLVLRMLGGDLPAGCKLLGASIETTQINARYACAAGEGRIFVRHPGDAPPAAVRAKQLALVVPEGSPLPVELTIALGERLRAEEAGWRWILEGRSLGRTIEQTGLTGRARALLLLGGAAAAIAFAATFWLALGLARQLPAGERAPEPWSVRRDLVAAGITIMAAFAFLEVAYPAAPVHPDTTRDLLMAAECVSGQPCDHGPPTTLGVFVQGALWTRFLALARALGMGIAATQAASLVLQAISAAIVLLVVRRSPRPALAPWVAAFHVVFGAFLIEAPILWNPSLAPLPLVAFYALTVALAVREDASLPLAAGAAAALGLAIDCHVLFAILLPVLLAATASSARRPLAATLAAVAALAATLLLDSRAAWLVNARALAASGAVIPLAGTLVLATVTGFVARARFRKLAPWSRAIVLVLAATVYTAGARGVLWFAVGGPASHRYLAPAAPGLAVLAALLMAMTARMAAKVVRARGEWLQAGIGVVAIAGARAALPAATVRGAGWTLAEAERAAAKVYEKAPSYRAVATRLRTRTPALTAAMAIFEPSGPRPGSEEGDDLVLLGLRGDARGVIDLGSRAAVLASVPPFLDRTRMSFCFTPREGASEEAGCVDAGLARHAPTTAEERAYPSLAAVRDAFPTDLLERMGAVQQTVTIAVRAVNGPAHRVELFDDGSGLAIERVTGVAYRGTLPGRRVVIEGKEGAGEIVIGGEVSRERKRIGPWWPPPIVEVGEDDAALVKALDEGRVE